MRIRVILECRWPSGHLKNVHATETHEVTTVGELFDAIEKSKSAAIGELPKWLPLAAKNTSHTSPDEKNA